MQTKHARLTTDIVTSDTPMKLKNIFIVGGTHGNERAGIHLARAINNNSNNAAFNTVAWSNLKVQGIIANEKAAAQNTRYFDEDLNRCFTQSRLNEASTSTYESARAQELNGIMGPKGPHTKSKADFIFDLHNSTSNTGMMLCLHRNDTLALEVAAHLHKLDTAIKIVFWAKSPGEDQPFLPTIGQSGMTVELGPVYHGTVSSVAMERVRVLLNQGLEYLNRRVALTDNQFLAQSKEHLIHIGERVVQVDFPRCKQTGDASAYIDAKLQGIEELADDNYLRPNQVLFTEVDGTTPALLFDAANYPEGPLYPVFVNEAAYFEKQTAFFLYQRVDNVPVRVLQ